MKIHQIYTDNALRNFTYFIEFNDQTVIVIDPWTDTLVNDFLDKHRLKLKTIINTHEHWDHVQGNAKLVEQHACEVWAHKNGIGKIPNLSRTLSAHEKIQLENDSMLEVLDTPGHSHAHLCFIIYTHNQAQYIFTGDTLFNAAIGNCHGGSVEDMFTTIQEQFVMLPDDIIILPGHDYLENNLNFTLNLEPSNIVAKEWLNKYHNSDLHNNPLKTTMADERQINTFFRLKNTEIIENLPKNTNNDKQVFFSIRALRDKW